MTAVEDLRSSSLRLLHVFASRPRVEIVKVLLHSEMVSLSEIAAKLAAIGIGISLPGLLKHMTILEDSGIVCKERGWVLQEPDARKAVYFLEGRDRVSQILQQLEGDVLRLLSAGETFNIAHRVARKLQGVGLRMPAGDKKHFETLLEKCEKPLVFDNLTEDEKKKIKLWRMMVSL